MFDPFSFNLKEEHPCFLYTVYSQSCRCLTQILTQSESRKKWLDLNFSHLNTTACHMIDSRFNFIGCQGSYNQNNCFIRPSYHIWNKLGWLHIYVLLLASVTLDSTVFLSMCNLSKSSAIYFIVIHLHHHPLLKNL